MPRRWGLLTAIALAIAVACNGAQTLTPEFSPTAGKTPSATSTARIPSATSAATDMPTATPSAVAAGNPTRHPTPTVDATPGPITPTQLVTSTPTPADIPTITVPVAEPTSTPEATPTPTHLAPGAFPNAPDADLYELARSLLLKTDEPISKVVNPRPVSYSEGRVDTFWLADLVKREAYASQATLRLVTTHAYWYVEEGVDASQQDLEKAAGIFEGEIYPRVTAAFGTESTPGVDNDPHLTILHARVKGADGYYSAPDEYPSSVNQYSNQREMIYVNAGLLKGVPDIYLALLAHELQHAIHWNGDPSEENWVNEGLSEVAVAVAGYRPTFQASFLRSPTISLINWPDQLAPYYGGAFLFLDYLATHYGSRAGLTAFVNEPADGIQGIDDYLARQGHDVTFRDVFKDWAVASYLDEPGGGPYSYPDREVRVTVQARLDGFGERASSIPQYSVEYWAIDKIKGDVRLRFRGQDETALLPVSLDGESCWWSNRGDSISSTLTRPLDLSAVSKATLRFRIWYDLEEEWDYAYVQVSSDRGSTWDILQTPHTSPRNPLGNSFGHGYTGRSDGWLREEVDLTPYAGKQVILRFHHVTDGAINAIGLCLDDISVPEIGFSDRAQGGSGWRADGFLRTDNLVPQDFIVQLIEVGDRTRVREMELDENNQGELVIRGVEELDEAVVVVAALAPKTIQEGGLHHHYRANIIGPGAPPASP